MLDFKTQSQLVDTTAAIMRSYLRAATDTFAVSASRGMSLWSQMLEAANPCPAATGQAQPPARTLVPFSWPGTVNWMATPQLATPWSAWPWMAAGNSGGMSWTPLVRTWWLGPSLTFWAPLADWSMWSRASFPAWNGWLTQALPPATRAASAGVAQRVGDDGGIASYRSAGGHAVAQVVMGPTKDRTSPPKRP